MKFKCLNEECNHPFMYPAKRTDFELTGNIAQAYVHPGDHMIKGQLEKHVCPFCGNLEFDEYVEPQPQIVSVKSVPIEDADALIKDGYVVLEGGIYAKTCNLVKKAEKSSLKERNESLDKDSEELRKDLEGFRKDGP